MSCQIAVRTMPLFPIAEPPADAGGDDLTSNERRLRLESLRPVVASASEGWLQVGRSYNAAQVLEGRKMSTPPTSNHEAVGSEAGPKTQASNGASRPKAADFFGATVGATDLTAGDSFRRDGSTEQSIAHLASGKGSGGRGGGGGAPEGSSKKNGKARKKRKRTTRNSSPSDEDIDSSGHKKSRHGRQHISKERDRSRKKDERVSRKSRKKHDGRSSRRRKARGSDYSGSEDSSDEGFSSRRRRSDSPDPRTSQLFVEDRKGDPDTLSFGGFYRLDVPLYHDGIEAARRKELRRKGRFVKTPRYFGRQATSANSDGNLARLQLWRGDKRKDHATKWANGRALAEGTAPAGGDDIRQAHHQLKGGADFLPVDAVVVSEGKHTAQSDLTASNVEQEDVFMESLEQWVTRRTKEFNVMTRERPDSEDVWLQFADFQEDAVRAAHGGGDALLPSSAAVVRITQEKRASVLEVALRHNPRSVRLRLAHLHLADELQEHDVVDSLWKGAIEKSNHSLTLWLDHLQFKAGHFASFSVPDQRSAYALCLRSLTSKREETDKAREEEHRTKGVFIMGRRSMLGDCKDRILAEKDLLEVIWSYCIMERAAGYPERALGVLQALVELNIQPSSAVSMDELESFWDSEAPRIGDAHPSLAGVSRWREAEEAARAKLPEQATGSEQQHVVPTRKLPARKSPGLRGKRKRAADFFDGGSLAATDEDFLSGEASTPLVQSKSHGSKQGGSKGGAGSDVLEKAYHAATALAVVQTSHTDGFPTPRRKYASDDDAPPESSHSHLDEQRSLFRAPPEGTQDSDGSSSEAVSAKRSEKHIAVPREASGQVESIQKGNPNTAPDKGARAVEAEGLIWVDNSQATAYSVRHGYRIDVQGAHDSVSGLEYGRILNQMRGDAADGHADRDVEAAAAASKRLRSRGERERDAEIAKQAAALEDVAEADEFSTWAKKEDAFTRHQWQPIRSTQDAHQAEEQPDRVLFVEDLRPLLFSLTQPASLRTLVGLLLSVGGLVFPRSDVSHSPKLMSEACCAASFGDGGLSGSLISTVSNGLRAVWSASGGDLPVQSRGIVECTGRQGSCLPPLVVSTAADQFLLLTDEVVRDVPRQTFIRNVLHHLIRAPEALPTMGAGAAESSESSGDILVQLQCTLVLFEGFLASAAGARHGQSGDSGNPPSSTETKGRSVAAWSDEDVHGHEARKVAKSLLEASQASATDLRLWSSYVQLLALLGSRVEAIKVAEKALSMLQALPEDKKVLSAELFWLAFRLHAGLPLSPRDPHAGVDTASDKSNVIGDMFEGNEKQGRGTREKALLVLCSFAEGSFTRPKTKKPKRGGKGSSSYATCATPPRLMTARKLMAGHAARLAAEQLQEGTGVDTSNPPEGAFDMTPSFMYYSVAWVWLEFLTRGREAAEKAMAKCLGLAQIVTARTDAGETDAASGVRGDVRLGGTLKGNKPYAWNVMSGHTSRGVCLERMHRAFSELVVLAQRYNPVETGPRKVREVLLRGLQSFPAEPGMLCLLLDAEEFSGSQQRLVHHFFEVSRRRALVWEQGPTPTEWIFSATHQVMRCVREARQTAITRAVDARSIRAVPPAYAQEVDTSALRVKSWLPGSYARLKRSMESAVTHRTGRRVPMLWRMYMSLEAMRGNHIQAKHLFWRAIHACPGNKAVWMDALRGHQRARIGAAGLRPAFPAKELNEVLDAILEKSLHLRVEPP